MTVRIYLASLLIVCSAIPVFCVQDLRMVISAQPSTITDGETPTAQIRCSLEGEFREFLLPYIRIYFKKPNPDEKQLAQVSGSTASITDSTLTSRATASGTIASTTTGSYLHLDLTSNVTCSDVGTYFCRSEYTDVNGTHSLEASSTIEGKSHPNELQLRHEPIKPKYSVGEQVLIICSGNVGKPAVDWNWQEYDEVDKLWKPHTSDISSTNAVPISDCAFHSTTTLTYRISDDKEHNFRCRAGPNVEYSVETSINGEISGASVLLISPVLLLCTMLHAIWR